MVWGLYDSLMEFFDLNDSFYFYLWSESFWECTDSLAWDFLTDETLLLDFWEASGSKLISCEGSGLFCFCEESFCDCLSLLSWISLMDSFDSGTMTEDFLTEYLLLFSLILLLFSFAFCSSTLYWLFFYENLLLLINSDPFWDVSGFFIWSIFSSTCLDFWDYWIGY